ncbi:MAG: 2-oxoacid:acceptor oxidoreductase family protein [Acidobacteria bacterium]|nr:2-oxoacid:acceptor oxidoreductase family protein [Acidobacteriota bacterium]
MSSYAISHERAHAFYDHFERKGELPHQTHYCPGCGHGIVHKLLASAIDGLGVRDRTVLVSPVGCSVFAYYYFDTGNVQAAHGRAPAVATGIKRSRPDSIVVAYQGDGDLAAIGTAEIIHAANRGESMTVIFVNNGIYGMTGGQMAPTTPLGKQSTTSPGGREKWNDGYPVHVCELLNALDAPVYLERVSLGDNKQIMQAAKAIRRALEYQVKGLGFSLVEVLSPCPTIWKLTPVEAQKFVRDEMGALFVPGCVRDRGKEAEARPARAAAPALADVPRLIGLTSGEEAVPAAERDLDLRIKIAGFGGQGVLMLGEVLAEAGLEAGYEVSWLPSYGPEMRSGTSNCHVRIGRHPVDSPLVSRPNVLLALNEPSLRKFLPAVEPGGVAIYNGREVPEGCERDDVRLAAIPVTAIADGIGAGKVANIVMLGALLELCEVVDEERVRGALRRLIHNDRYYELDLAALERGREEGRKLAAEAYGWGV